ncbi:hypothetical protein BKN38_08205 [Helicobacter sp. CLO-3]|uniref:hypothetical protein n=1 Tax=unclassified Helicobacter TaxID=2593540 RepID=UPI0008049E80|nr:MULTISPECIES: hypothetical protein [unclassified Helicobacter]OBV28761.1 hypothetical protein BA723_08215 [Helicobacter sp. CLO-3]OHU81866.1 hypothetical protein BKN38_08205 [Helicobacter sp. CLO-3]
MKAIAKYFSLKGVIRFCVIAFVVLFFAGGCSFSLMDWQYYKFESLLESTSGLYIIDDKLYKEVKNKYPESSSDGKGSLGLLSNGYEAFYKNKDDSEQVNSRILSSKQYKRYYIDDNGVEHIISFEKTFGYVKCGLWINFEEVRFYYAKWSGFIATENVFYKDLSDEQKAKQMRAGAMDGFLLIMPKIMAALKTEIKEQSKWLLMKYKEAYERWQENTKG